MYKRQAYKENTPLILPMYYTYPAEQVAYTVKNEYEYGTAFIVAPVTEKSVQGVGRARTHVWLPEGTYIDFFTGLVYSCLLYTSVPDAQLSIRDEAL